MLFIETKNFCLSDPLTDYVKCFPTGKRLKRHYDRYVILSDFLGYYITFKNLSRRRASETVARLYRADYRDIEDYSASAQIVVQEDAMWVWYGKLIELQYTTEESPESKSSTQRIRTSDRIFFVVPISCSCECIEEIADDIYGDVMLSTRGEVSPFEPYFKWTVDEEKYEFTGCSEVTTKKMPLAMWCNGVVRERIEPRFEIEVEVERASGRRDYYEDTVEGKDAEKIYKMVIEKCLKCMEKQL